MTERPIRLFGDPILKAPGETIETIDDGVRALIDDLIDTVEQPGRAGVAAAQIGVGSRAFSYNVDGRVGYLINPEIVELGGEPEPMDEGCLSVPGLWFPTMRHPYARARGIDLSGAEVEVEGTGVLAQALQHETDHLAGMLYIDRLDKENRRAAMKQIRESDWF